MNASGVRVGSFNLRDFNVEKPEDPVKIGNVAKFITDSKVHIASLQEVGNNLKVGQKYRVPCTDCNVGLDLLIDSMQSRVPPPFVGYKKTTRPPYRHFSYAYEQHLGCKGAIHEQWYNHNNAIVYDDEFIKPLGDTPFPFAINKYCDLDGGLLQEPCLLGLTDSCRHAIVFPYKFNDDGMDRTMVHVNVHLTSGLPATAWRQLSEVLEFVKSQPNFDFNIAGDFNMKFEPRSPGKPSTMSPYILAEHSEVVKLLMNRKMMIPFLKECYPEEEQRYFSFEAKSERKYECESLDHIWFIMKKDTTEQLELKPADLYNHYNIFGSHMNRRYNSAVSNHGYLYTHISLKPATIMENKLLLDDELPLTEDFDKISFGNQPKSSQQPKRSIFDDYPNLL